MTTPERPNRRELLARIVLSGLPVPSTVSFDDATGRASLMFDHVSELDPWYQVIAAPFTPRLTPHTRPLTGERIVIHNHYGEWNYWSVSLSASEPMPAAAELEPQTLAELHQLVDPLPPPDEAPAQPTGGALD